MDLLGYVRNNTPLVMKRHFFLVTPFQLQSLRTLMPGEFPDNMFASFWFSVCCWTSTKGSYLCWRIDLHSCLYSFFLCDFVEDVQMSKLQPMFPKMKIRMLLLLKLWCRKQNWNFWALFWRYLVCLSAKVQKIVRTIQVKHSDNQKIIYSMENFYLNIILHPNDCF